MLRTTPIDDNWEFSCAKWETGSGKLAFSSHEWRSARVPGHVHRDLVDHGIIADPFEALHELGCQWVDEEDWSYRTAFNFEPNLELPHRHLRFEGLDCVCQILLNGVHVADSDNMFVPLEIDVGDALVAGKNELRVEFASATRVGRERRAAYFARERLPESLRNFDERAFVRKAQYMFGWDWGPRLVSAGIWRPVRLLESAGRILDVHVRQEYLADGSVKLVMSSQCEGSGDVVHRIEGHEGWLREGEILRIAQPRLWWPAGLGEPHLYEVETYLLEPGASLDSISKTSIRDRRCTRFGLRRVSLLQLPDGFGESFEFVVNGKRIWAVGANWIPDHSLPSAVTSESVRGQVLRARDLNMNMLRVWGGGLYESDEFYSACDEFGILVWQDFAYACGYYPDDDAALRQARKEAEVNIVRLRNHPSLALWCGNNENSMMFDMKWGGADNQPPRFHGAKLFDEVLPELLQKLDRTRCYVPSSPCGGTFSNSGGTGDQHTWDVWHGRGDWKFYSDSTARFSSEFGFASAPTARAWRRMFPEQSDLGRLGVHHEIARWHDKTAKGYDTFRQMVELHYPTAENLEQWSYYSQLNQRDALRSGVEHFRRSEFCKGALIWQFNDCWPVQSWALIDSCGGRKAAAYEVRRLFAPLLLSLELLDGTLRLWAILDNAVLPVGAQAKLVAHDLRDGSELRRWQVPVSIQPGQRCVVIEADVREFEPTQTLAVATLLDSTAFRLLAEPRIAEHRLPSIDVGWRTNALHLRSNLPVVDLQVWDEDGTVEWIDNFCTLPTAGTSQLRVIGTSNRLRARCLAGEVPVNLKT